MFELEFGYRADDDIMDSTFAKQKELAEVSPWSCSRHSSTIVNPWMPGVMEYYAVRLLGVESVARGASTEWSVR